jgi:hypothetical protein
MKKTLLILCLTMLAGPLLHAQTITKEERTKAVAYLTKTRQDLVAATKGLSKAQWDFKPATNRWSIAETTEHIAASEDMLMGMVQDQLMKAPARTESEDIKALDEFVMQRIPDRTSKVQAPEPLQPNNRFGSPKETLAHFRESRAKTIKFLRDTKDLREHAMDSPFGKKLDGYQWLLFIGAHSERHTKQIEEVKADPGFPQKK